MCLPGWLRSLGSTSQPEPLLGAVPWPAWSGRENGSPFPSSQRRFPKEDGALRAGQGRCQMAMSAGVVLLWWRPISIFQHKQKNVWTENQFPAGRGGKGRPQHLTCRDWRAGATLWRNPGVFHRPVAGECVSRTMASYGYFSLEFAFYKTHHFSSPSRVFSTPEGSVVGGMAVAVVGQRREKEQRKRCLLKMSCSSLSESSGWEKT